MAAFAIRHSMEPFAHTVLHVMNSASGGAALSTLGLIDHLRSCRVASCAVCHPSGSPTERRAIEEATEGRVLFTPLYWWNKKIRASFWKRPLLEVRQLVQTGWIRGSTRKIVQFAQQQRVDIVHSNTIVTLEGAYASRLLGLPHVWHLRELVGPGHPFQFWLAGKQFGRFIERHCEALIANSNVTAALIRDFVPPSLLHVIPNGIELRHFTGRDSKPKSPIVVAMVASLTCRWKNHELFIKAAQQVNPALPVEFRIYGSDPSQGGKVRGDIYADALHDLVHFSGLTNRFSWQGFVERPEQIMSEIDILVHPTTQESFGRVAVEAMAAGLPVVGVRGGGIAEVVEDGITGWIVEPEDATALARKIEHLVRDEQCRDRFGKAGAARAHSEYSLDRCARRIAEVYERLVSKPDPASSATEKHQLADQV
jgi:glycosyltransferase involved in cell wall biosynthesis